VLLFGVAPWALSLGPRWLVLPSIVTGGMLCLVLLLRDPTFPRERLLDRTAARRWLRPVLLRTVVVWAGIVLVALVARGPQGLFFLPRARPALWVAIVALYPVLSVYPQEVMYRTFFFHRYSGILGRPRTRVLVNAALFGWAHVIVHNTVAMLLTAVGGVLFALTYQRSRSTLLVAVEHALYGGFVFTVGIGGMFVTGVRLLSKVMP
jgi:hypothetical protein